MRYLGDAGSWNVEVDYIIKWCKSGEESVRVQFEIAVSVFYGPGGLSASIVLLLSPYSLFQCSGASFLGVRSLQHYCNVGISLCFISQFSSESSSSVQLAA